MINQMLYLEQTILFLLNEVKNEINKLFPDRKLYLVGSYSKGKQREDSDLDFYLDPCSVKEANFLNKYFEGKYDKKIDFLSFAKPKIENEIK
jgi:predicted nucleotidyltransferase